MKEKDTRVREWGVRVAMVAAGAWALAGAVLFAWGGAVGPEIGPFGHDREVRRSGPAPTLPPAFPIRMDGNERRTTAGVLSRGRSRLPDGIVFPVAGPHRLTESFGDPRGRGRSHRGVDIMAEKGTPVVAAADGVVRWMHDEVGGNCCDVALIHEDGWGSRYIHLNNDTPGTDDGRGYGIAPNLAVGVEVRQGQVVGWVGDSGNAEATGSHLHFELIRPDGEPLDPHEILMGLTGGGPVDEKPTTPPRRNLVRR